VPAGFACSGGVGLGATSKRDDVHFSLLFVFLGTRARAKKKGPISQCGKCLFTVKTAHGFSYTRSPITKGHASLQKRSCRPGTGLYEDPTTDFRTG